jgi:hypothetical protein
MSFTIYFRSLAARCRKSARECSDYFAKEEFRRLANEFDAKANQIEGSSLPPDASAWWKQEQSRGFAGDR